MQTNPAGLCVGTRSIDELSIGIVGNELKIKPKRKGRSLSELLDATPQGLCRANGWDELGATGGEL